MSGWRTMVLQEKCEVGLRDTQLVINGKSRHSIPISQLRQILIASSAVTISAAVLAFLANAHVHVLFCGEKHMPACEMIPIGMYHEAAGEVMDQAAWKEQNKDRIWKAIVESKLKIQYDLLTALDRTPPPRFLDYYRTVEDGDKTNREAMAAKMYFTSLFGHDFRRHRADELNAKLNYGYTILCSAFTRILALHGYHSGLGIHHCSRDNPVNLSCDLMEPFRPLIDRIAFESGEAPLDWELKKRFISFPQLECRMNEKRVTLDQAIEEFTLQTLAAVKEGKASIPEVDYVRP